MNATIKKFIEKNIELINQAEFYQMYEEANEWLSDRQITELTRILEKTLNVELERHAKQCALDKFKLEINNWLAEKSLKYDDLYLFAFVQIFMSTIYGLDFDEFQQLVYEYLEAKPHKNIDYIVDGEGNIMLRRVK